MKHRSPETHQYEDVPATVASLPDSNNNNNNNHRDGDGDDDGSDALYAAEHGRHYDEDDETQPVLSPTARRSPPKKKGLARILKDIDDEHAAKHAAHAAAQNDRSNNNSRCTFFTVCATCMGVLVTVCLVLLSWRHSVYAAHDANGLPAGQASLISDSSGGVNSKSHATSSGTTTASHHVIHKDPAAAERWNVFDNVPVNPNVWTPPNPWSTTTSDDDDSQRMGYLQQPDLVNDTLVFVSEGDLYLTRLLSASSSSSSSDKMPAMKLTVTAGNVMTPKLHPVRSYLLAYTATYTGRREIYLQDLRTNQPAVRLTYADHAFGISAVVGWKATGDGSVVLLYAAGSNAVSLPDTRLYELTLNMQQQQQQSTGAAVSGKHPVLGIAPVPLSQAVSGSYDGTGQCLYFTRFKQSSRTYRYVGGTAESLWVYCDGQELAQPLTANYNGTSKDAHLYHSTTTNHDYLLFLSDRSPADQAAAATTEWRATTMDLWAMPLSTANANGLGMVQLTHVSCQYNGRSLQEYAVDAVTGNVVLRIGADLHLLSAIDIQDRLRESQQQQNGEGPPRFLKASSRMLPTPRLAVAVYSDFHEQQERIIPISMTKHLKGADVYETAFGSTAMLMTVRGQLWVAPVIEDVEAIKPYSGAGQNMPGRRYRVVPGAMTGGSVRVLAALHVPLLLDEGKSARRLAVVLATDPLSPTAEHAFYLVETQTDSVSSFSDLDNLPEPLVGGNVNGGSTADGGLGSVDASSLAVSPCGRRLAWTDTDGRICVMTLPVNANSTSHTNVASYIVLPDENELGEPITGLEADLLWSPGGRYLAVGHNARNQFRIISIVDCGNPEGETPDEIAGVAVGRIAQVTPARFNSQDMFWGKSTFDIDLYEQNMDLAKKRDEPEPDDVATTLFFLTDRDITSSVDSPWGSRAPSPNFPREFTVYALPLMPKPIDGEAVDASRGRFSGGGAAEVFVDDILALEQKLDEDNKKEDGSERRLSRVFQSLTRAVNRRRRIRKAEAIPRHLTSSPSAAPTADKEAKSPFPKDADIDFGPNDLTFARRAHRMAGIPKGSYLAIVSQTLDDASLVLVAKIDDKLVLQIFSADEFPSDFLDSDDVLIKGLELAAVGLSTNREHIYVVFAPGGITRVILNTSGGLRGLIKDEELTKRIVDTEDLGISVWPVLEYKQMFNDAWRLLRDYFYDKDMTGLDWPSIHERYLSLVQRCGKREELDDVLVQMASELSALHVFVYGGEYNTPDDALSVDLHKPASLGATLKRVPEWKGYVVTEIPLRDPDFNLIEGEAIYCPLSDQALRPSGQRGLEVGDVIVGVNGESVMSVPAIDMLLRGMAGRSVRLEVIRLVSGSKNSTGSEEAFTEPLLTVPISQDAAETLRYDAWEWKTRQKAKQLAAQAGFSVGYVHMRAMGREDMDAFARGYFPDYDKQTLILDVRHNMGGNIDSWILDILQRKAWQYWGGRTGVKRKGDMDWDQQFAFRGHIVVLIDEKTSSDGEGVSRGMSELGLGRLIGKRTWGGGIWLGSDNKLVDDGIATAPEIGTYNEKFGWGLGIEQHGVVPDIDVDNNPRTTFDGKDTQLERAIAELKQWLQGEPVVIPKPMAGKRDMSLQGESCPV